ncbi:carboxylesterase/lipase family protein [Streptomyces sp. NPDC006692]|uniref:carboxylesterase/lipase family protein n=1 Tax=Streptomyces sp. NPDC006692 TaxID=3364758 RepID=UPI00368C3F97
MTGTGIERVVVNTERGKVRGVVEGEAVSFRGIPYAASPVGELRFASPRPHAGWTEVRDAAQAGPSVPQAASRLEKVQGQRVPDWNEDGSLTVNVFTPRRALTDGVARPVLVWWHGGGFTSGSGGWDWYDGARLAALGDIVVVTANYRVGPLGYLYLPRIGAANLGSQDQAAVLRWVQDNVASFGGDARTVTVGGQSAGAYSSLMLALDPETSGSITRVLLQSGPFGLAPQDAHQAAENADAYLRLLGIPAGTDTAKALRALPAERLLDAYGRLSAQLAVPGNAAPPMYPVLGGPGMPRTRQQAVADGALEGKPLLIGTTRDESTAFFAFDPRIQNLTTTAALDVLTAQVGQQAAQDVYQRHAARLPQATPAQIFTAVQTDELFRDGSLEIADHHAAGGNTTYVYEFDHAPAEDPYALGATHCAELPFLFNTFDAFRDSPVLAGAGATQRALGHEFATAVAEFVTTGTTSDWLPYAPATAARIRRFG